MAMAVQKLYKDAQVTIGPWIDRGFYYDFDLKQPLTDKELKQIKKEMQKIAKAKLPFIREDVSAGVGIAAGSALQVAWALEGGACTPALVSHLPARTLPYPTAALLGGICSCSAYTAVLVGMHNDNYA